MSRPITLALSAAFAIGALATTACGEAEDAVEEVQALEACDDYCDRKFECADEDPTDEEDDECTNECEDTLNNTCDRENRDQAIETLNDCVDNSCGEFTACLVFEAAPECFDFVD